MCFTADERQKVVIYKCIWARRARGCMLPYPVDMVQRVRFGIVMVGVNELI